MKKPQAPTFSAPRAPEAETKPQWTEQQEARRRRWAETLCGNAQNDCSLTLARKLCRGWFKDCQCIRHGEN
jgi:hypothetical protein